MRVLPEAWPTVRRVRVVCGETDALLTLGVRGGWRGRGVGLGGRQSKLLASFTHLFKYIATRPADNFKHLIGAQSTSYQFDDQKVISTAVFGVSISSGGLRTSTRTTFVPPIFGLFFCRTSTH